MWEETGGCSRAWVRATLTRWAKRENEAPGSPARSLRPGAAVVLSTRSRHYSRIAAERDRAADGVSDIYEFGEPRR
jgi:hypothetical protein